MNDTVQDKHLFAVKNWHAALVIFTWLIVTIASFVTMQSQTAQNVKDIERLKQDMVTKGQYDEMRQDIIHRLDRIESKMDERLALKDMK